ncbi:hypothetical protein Bfae_02590 [Brachybacterium faecium DSM 4810]|uniref:Uncharacterized protein n=1 Tax=Brachybacterium faecium (strain ATCC 43885 / DSM 4810 / JCM 11609 / LMG 19847 / NBRC 14762 / NCIMB 9860 / 6-10) TaxID=446465 RepID=C7MG18_BRAFD|nr:hypothetical protein [Brachybacterium faecium]ACU84136.1 hypothetical protein Bfae_02590 [Brachybacterium faecium DSM 4810]HJG51315.1 hypothetical protein [Brachybacterium faecium]
MALRRAGPAPGRALPLGWEDGPEPATSAPRAGEAEPAAARPGLSRRRLLALGAAVLLVLALALAVPRLLTDPAGPEQAVSEFLQAVIDGDLESVREQVEDAPDASGAALTPEILAGAEDTLRSFMIEDVEIAAGTATVTAALETGATAETSTFTLTATPGGAFSPPDWQLDPVPLPEISIVLPLGVQDVQINGTLLPQEELEIGGFMHVPQVALQVLPGTYELSVGGEGRWVDAAEISLTAPPTFGTWRKPVPDMVPALNEAGRQEVRDQLEGMLADCVESTSPAPEGCPLAAPGTEPAEGGGAPEGTWTLTDPLELDIDHLGGLPWTVHGTGRAQFLPEDADEDAEPVEAEVELDALVFLDVDDALQVQRIDDHLSYTYCIDVETGEVTGMTVIDGAEEAEDSDGCEW